MSLLLAVFPAWALSRAKARAAAQRLCITAQQPRPQASPADDGWVDWHDEAGEIRVSNNPATDLALRAKGDAWARAGGIKWRN